jgi:hypothetical protein
VLTRCVESQRLHRALLAGSCISNEVESVSVGDGPLTAIRPYGQASLVLGGAVECGYATSRDEATVLTHSMVP